MINTDQILINIKNELYDEGVFSEDQIKALITLTDRLDDYIDSKLENFAQRNL